MASKSEAQEKFYHSKQWIKMRNYIMAKNNYICESCGSVATIVHHKIHLNDSNINDIQIALGEENLMSVCIECHNSIHYSQGMIEDGLKFTSDGDIIKLSETF